MRYPAYPLFPSNIRVIDSSADPVVRLRVTDDVDSGPPPMQGGRPKGCKRLHTNATVAAVRRLIEETTLTYKQIAARTGATHSTVGRWAREGGWQRHPFAPVASDTLRGARAGRRLKLRVLREKLQALAERCVTELWNSPTVDLDRLIQAMQVAKMARLQAMGNRRPRRHPDAPARTGQHWIDRDTAIRTALKEMRRGGVNIDRIPVEAMALLEDAHTPPERDHPALRPRGPRRRV
ncbi:hypothetical protein [Tardiphaga sp. P9-11]|uniref:hypothetical protein n=1 Tax=Tardiphaga sp. P9-11 TaxID=2024614 RepID=UPI0011F2C099|nr:hypothetical protein [Tardiphaga sp. P9-11]KAA0076572.1 hypothetical protein CIW50_10280 [Tardiphaga sp. P9-11]